MTVSVSSEMSPTALSLTFPKGCLSGMTGPLMEKEERTRTGTCLYFLVTKDYLLTTYAICGIIVL